ncbi:MAG: SMI1/KNR4 family protein, partial [Sulfitobacter sp.]
SLPKDYCEMMALENGGRINLGREQWWLHPIFDMTDKKRIKRTCNHVLLETRNRAEYGGFPGNGLEIAGSGGGDALLFLFEDGQCADDVFEFDHDAHVVRKTKWTARDLLEKRESQ